MKQLPIDMEPDLSGGHGRVPFQGTVSRTSGSMFLGGRVLFAEVGRGNHIFGSNKETNRPLKTGDGSKGQRCYETHVFKGPTGFEVLPYAYMNDGQLG